MNARMNTVAMTTQNVKTKNQALSVPVATVTLATGFCVRTLMSVKVTMTAMTTLCVRIMRDPTLVHAREVLKEMASTALLYVCMLEKLCDV